MQRLIGGHAQSGHAVFALAIAAIGLGQCGTILIGPIPLGPTLDSKKNFKTSQVTNIRVGKEPLCEAVGVFPLTWLTVSLTCIILPI